MVTKELKALSYVELIAIIASLAAGGYYTYLYGWVGFAYSVLSFIFGIMIMYWFGDLFPVIGPWLRREERRLADRGNQKEDS